MIELRGDAGEGGGQVLRTALSLSAATGRPFRIVRIRGARPNPGLRAQHLEAIRATGRVCTARFSDVAVGASELEFHPGAVTPGHYESHVGTAGSATLILQTVLWPLALSGSPSEVRVSGGTHVPRAPCFDFLELAYAPAVARIGVPMTFQMSRAGFYPRGGGEIVARIPGGAQPEPLELVARGELRDVEVRSLVARLPRSIAERQAAKASSLLAALGLHPEVTVLEVAAASPGTAVVVLARFERWRTCVFSLGERGKPAEQVAAEAVAALTSHLTASGAVDRHLADQLLIPLALAKARSLFTVDRVTSHLLTNAAIVREFTEAKITIEGEIDEPGRVSVLPRAVNLHVPSGGGRRA